MEPINLRRLKRPQLIELAGHFKIKRRHRLRKRELVKRLEKLLPQIPEKLSLAFLQPRKTRSSTHFAPPSPPPQQGAFVDRGAPIPLHYGRDTVTALVRDPNSLYIYWELEGPRREEIQRRHGADVLDGASWILRVHSEDAGSTRDIPVVLEGFNWYLSVAENRTYEVEIGVVPRGGGFLSFARSNRVTTPRMGMSPDTTREWMLVEDGFRRVVRLGASDVPYVPGAFADTLAERFRVPDMSSRFLGGSEHVPGSAHLRRRSERSTGK